MPVVKKLLRKDFMLFPQGQLGIRWNKIACTLASTYDLVSRANEILSCDNKILSDGNEMLTCGNKILTYGNKISHSHHLLSPSHHFLTRSHHLLTISHHLLYHFHQLKIVATRFYVVPSRSVRYYMERNNSLYIGIKA